MFDNYSYILAGRKIIALSTYAGKTVKGIAICDDRDIFNEEKGMALAAARCNEKVARKRLNRATLKYNEAQEALKEAEAYVQRMSEYYYSSFTAWNEAGIAVDNVLKEM